MTYSEREQFQRTPGYNDLLSAIQTVLARKGVLAQLRANMIYSVFECARDESGDNLTQLMGNPNVVAFGNTGKFKVHYAVDHSASASQPSRLSPAAKNLIHSCRCGQRGLCADTGAARGPRHGLLTEGIQC
jgi:hypothetical protein